MKLITSLTKAVAAAKKVAKSKQQSIFVVFDNDYSAYYLAESGYYTAQGGFMDDVAAIVEPSGWLS